MKDQLKKLWNWVLNRTTLDEKIIELAEEVEARIDRVKEEVDDPYYMQIRRGIEKLAYKSNINTLQQ